MVRRIVSLLPAASEIVSALDATDLLVGRSHECDWPKIETDIPALTAARIDSTASSSEIDQAVKNSESGHLFFLDEQLLQQLRPDLILTQSACNVCAVDVDAVSNVAASISLSDGNHPEVVALAPHSLKELIDDIRLIATKIGKQNNAKKLIASLHHRIDTVGKVVLNLNSYRKKQPRIALIEWLDPPMAAGNWVPEMIQMAGATDALEADAGKSHWIRLEDVAAADPDFVILIPCGFDLQRVLTEAKTQAVWTHLKDLRATREGNLFGVDGHHLFNRPGPRLIDSLEVLAEILYPESFQFKATTQFAKRIEP